MTPEWILMEETQVEGAQVEGILTEEVSTEEICVMNLIEEWILTEDKNSTEEKNSTGDMILTQDFHFGGYIKNYLCWTTNYQYLVGSFFIVQKKEEMTK